jgi:uncharacterized coiled-coil DUF342 family protein
MSDFIKNLKSLFVEEASGSGSKSKSETAGNISEGEISGKEEGQKDQKTTSFQFEDDSSGTGKVSTKFTKVLLKAIEKNNMGGFDYLEYKNSIKSLSKMDMDEETRFKSAFAMAQTMGASADKLIKSANYYQKVLTQEKVKFDEAAKQQMEVKVNSKKAEIEKWEAEIKAKTKQIESLKKSIDDLRKKANSVSESLDSEARKVQGTQRDFVATFNNLYNQIGADLTKMNNYLK